MSTSWRCPGCRIRSPTPSWSTRYAGRVRAAVAHPVTYDSWTQTPAEAQLQPPFEQLATYGNVLVMSFYVAMASSIAEAVDYRLSIDSYDTVVFGMGAFAAPAACEAHGVPYALMIDTIPITRWWPGRPCPGQGRRWCGDDNEDERLARIMAELIDATCLWRINRV